MTEKAAHTRLKAQAEIIAFVMRSRVLLSCSTLYRLNIEWPFCGTEKKKGQALITLAIIQVTSTNGKQRERCMRRKKEMGKS